MDIAGNKRDVIVLCFSDVLHLETNKTTTIIKQKQRQITDKIYTIYGQVSKYLIVVLIFFFFLQIL